MEDANLRVVIKNKRGGKDILILERVLPGMTVAELMLRIRQSLNFAATDAHTKLAFKGKKLARKARLRDCLPMTGATIELVLIQPREDSSDLVYGMTANEWAGFMEFANSFPSREEMTAAWLAEATQREARDPNAPPAEIPQWLLDL